MHQPSIPTTNGPDRLSAETGEKPRGRRAGLIPRFACPCFYIRHASLEPAQPNPAAKPFSFPSGHRRSVDPLRISPREDEHALVNGGILYDLLPLTAAAGEGLLRLLPRLRLLHAGLAPPLHRPRPVNASSPDERATGAGFLRVDSTRFPPNSFLVVSSSSSLARKQKKKKGILLIWLDLFRLIRLGRCCAVCDEAGQGGVCPRKGSAGRVRRPSAHAGDGDRARQRRAAAVPDRRGGDGRRPHPGCAPLLCPRGPHASARRRRRRLPALHRPWRIRRAECRREDLLQRLPKLPALAEGDARHHRQGRPAGAGECCDLQSLQETGRRLEGRPEQVPQLQLQGVSH